VSHLIGLVSGSIEVVSAFCDGEEVADVSESLGDGIETASGSLAQQRLEFREGHLDRIKIGRIGWQEEKPCAFRLTICSARSLLWKPTLSRMTTSPGDSVGASCVSIQVSKMRRFIGALTINGATMPCDLRPAMKVCVFHERRGSAIALPFC